MSDDRRQLARRNARTAAGALAVVAAMAAFVAASPTIYDIVCRAIGLDGTTQVATAAPAQTAEVSITVLFDANVDKALPWEFRPNQKTVTVRLGETATVSYHARNLADHPTTGTATFNVTPEKTGMYFNKLECFCFQEQTLGPGESADMGITFFVDPAMMDDATTEEVRNIALSYTFFRSLDDMTQAGEDAVADDMKLSAAVKNAGAVMK